MDAPLRWYLELSEEETDEVEDWLEENPVPEDSIEVSSITWVYENMPGAPGREGES